MKRTRHHSILVLGILSAIALTGTASAADKARTQRGELVHRIVMKWGNHVQETYRADVGRWATGLAPVFANAPIDRLRRAANTHDFARMNDILHGMDGSGTASTGKRTLTKALGDEAADLTFIPLPTPCRMIDTRVVGGRIAANSTRHYNIAGQPNFQTYGGDAGDCGLINASMAAIAVNITSVGPSQSGFLRAYPFGGTVPSVATLGYVSGQINDNFAIVPLDQSAAGDELSIYSFAQTDIVVDAVGYFIRPQATALECTNVTASDQIAANTVGTVNSATCPADYNLTGGGCDSTVPTMTQTNVARPVGALNGDFFRCVIRNNNGSPITATAYGRCCRTPGR